MGTRQTAMMRLSILEVGEFPGYPFSHLSMETRRPGEGGNDLLVD